MSALSAGALEYANCTSAGGRLSSSPPPNECLESDNKVNYCYFQIYSDLDGSTC